MLQRTRYLNAQNTFSELLSMGVVPIVNENDTVSVSVCHPRRSHLTWALLIARKSNSATMTPYLRYRPQSSTPTSCSYSQTSSAYTPIIQEVIPMRNR